MKKILDLHIHSKYSRACSRDLDLPNIARACEVKGIDIVSSGDFTHPKWIKHIKENLEEWQEGIYKMKNSLSGTKFILGTELSLVKKHKGQTRRIHACVYAPSIKIVEKFNKRLEKMGFNLKSDGRPILGLTVKELLEIMISVDVRMELIPAHAWTPWFAIFGSKSGYDSLEEAFEELTPRIHVIETGLSSDPRMNWGLSQLDNITLISNSDAHSTAKLGREANVFEFGEVKKITYTEIFRIINTGDKKNFLYTIEFYPEEGKYYADGCSNCKFSSNPKETKKLKGLCPKCKKKMTVGVLTRIDELADRNEEESLKIGKEKMIPYKSLVPLPEIIADVFVCGVNTKKVSKQYDELIEKLGSEFKILLDISIKKIESVSSIEIASAIKNVREGKVETVPGYDGIFGKIKI